jgi:hypothetical protein
LEILLRRKRLVNVFHEPHLFRHAKQIVSRRANWLTYRAIADELGVSRIHVENCARIVRQMEEQWRCLRVPPLLFSFQSKGTKPMVKISTFHHQPLQHVQYMGDGTVLLKFYDQWGRQPRHIRVSLEE